MQWESYSCSEQSEDESTASSRERGGTGATPFGEEGVLLILGERI